MDFSVDAIDADREDANVLGLNLSSNAAEGSKPLLHQLCPLPRIVRAQPESKIARPGGSSAESV